MPSGRAIRWTTFGILGGAVATIFLVPSLSVTRSASAQPAAPDADVIRFTGVVRDFLASHSDFDAMPADGTGHVAGSVLSALGDEGHPAFNPVLTVTPEPYDGFTMIDQRIVPGEAFALKVEVLGAAIYTGVYHEPVTTRFTIGGQVFDPFGPYGAPVEGNVNNDQSVTGNANPGTNPREYVFSTIFDADAEIVAAGQSWNLADEDDSGLSNSHWSSKRIASTSTNDPQIWVLRDGDPVPDVDGAYDQDSVEEFIADYIDSAAGEVDIDSNQAIYLFELGTDHDNDSADFQDLVLLVSLATHPSHFIDSDGDGEPDGDGGPIASGGGYFVDAQWTDENGTAIAPHLADDGSGMTVCGSPVVDNPGTVGDRTDAAIDDSASFDQWYQAVLGTNLETLHSIELTRNIDGVYEYLTDEFHPIDGQLFGDEGADHNYNFTFALDVEFTYNACTDQFFEFEGGDGAWMFIDDQLAIDLGGVNSSVNQTAQLDRLGLVDGQTYTMHLFYSQRTPGPGVFRLRTNVSDADGEFDGSITASFD